MNTSLELSPLKRLVPLKLVLAVTVLDSLFFSLTTPNTNNSLLIIAGICLLAAGAYVWSGIFVLAVSAVWPLTRPTGRRLVIFLTVVSTLLLVLQSIGQLSWHDAAVIIPFAVMLYVYIVYVAVPVGRPSRQ